MGKTNKAQHKNADKAQRASKSIHTAKAVKAEEQAVVAEINTTPDIRECVNCGHAVTDPTQTKCADCLLDEAFYVQNKSGVKVDVPETSEVAAVLAAQDAIEAQEVETKTVSAEDQARIDKAAAKRARKQAQTKSPTIAPVMIITAQGVTEASITGDTIETAPELPDMCNAAMRELSSDTPPEVAAVEPVVEESLEARIARLTAEINELKGATTPAAKTDKPKGAKYAPVNVKNLPDIGITIGGVFALAIEAAGRPDGVTYPEVKVLWREHKYASTNTALEDLLERRLVIESGMTASRIEVLNKRCKMLAGKQKPFETSLPGSIVQIYYPKYCTIKVEGETREGKTIYKLWDIEKQEVVVL